MRRLRDKFDFQLQFRAVSICIYVSMYEKGGSGVASKLKRLKVTERISLAPTTAHSPFIIWVEYQSKRSLIKTMKPAPACFCVGGEVKKGDRIDIVFCWCLLCSFLQPFTAASFSLDTNTSDLSPRSPRPGWLAVVIIRTPPPIPLSSTADSTSQNLFFFLICGDYNLKFPFIFLMGESNFTGRQTPWLFEQLNQIFKV